MSTKRTVTHSFPNYNVYDETVKIANQLFRGQIKHSKLNLLYDG